jgi:hypothetical protein
VRWACLIPWFGVPGLGVGWAAIASCLHIWASSAEIADDRAWTEDPSEATKINMIADRTPSREAAMFFPALDVLWIIPRSQSNLMTRKVRKIALPHWAVKQIAQHFEIRVNAVSGWVFATAVDQVEPVWWLQNPQPPC